MKNRIFVSLILLAILFSLSISIVTASAEETAPTFSRKSVLEDAVEFKGNYYKLFNNNFTWEQAKSFCEGLGGHLVTLNAPDEDNFCYFIFRSSNLDFAFIGASDINNEGNWSWVTGEEWKYNNFAYYEPNGAYSQNVLAFNRSYPTGEWDDFYSDCKTGFICEWEKEDAQQIDNQIYFLIQNNVDSGEISVYHNSIWANGHIYKIMNHSFDWYEANVYCNAIGGHLATIDSHQENQTLFAYVTLNQAYGAAIGATDKNIPNLWEWVTGQSFTYSNWNYNEPDASYGDDYIGFASENGKWNDINWSNSFICEWDVVCINGDKLSNEHDFSSWQVKDDAVCGKSGLLFKTCENCGTTETQATDALSHQYSEWKTIQSATCSQKGIEARTCSLCGNSETEEFGQAEHNFSKWEKVDGNILIPPISQIRKCDDCDFSESRRNWYYMPLTILSWIIILLVAIAIISGFVRNFSILKNGRTKRYDPLGSNLDGENVLSVIYLIIGLIALAGIVVGVLWIFKVATWRVVRWVLGSIIYLVTVMSVLTGVRMRRKYMEVGVIFSLISIANFVITLIFTSAFSVIGIFIAATCATLLMVCGTYSMDSYDDEAAVIFILLGAFNIIVTFTTYNRIHNWLSWIIYTLILLIVAFVITLIAISSYEYVIPTVILSVLLVAINVCMITFWSPHFYHSFYEKNEYIGQTEEGRAIIQCECGETKECGSVRTWWIHVKHRLGGDAEQKCDDNQHWLECPCGSTFSYDEHNYNDDYYCKVCEHTHSGYFKPKT